MTVPYLLVLAHARSGSNHLLDLLRAFRGVSTLGEFFNVSANAPGKEFRTEALAPFEGSQEKFVAEAERNPLNTLRFLDDVAGVDLFVIKLFGHQLRNTEARRILIENSVGVIHLRRNLLATWISRETARVTGKWFNDSSESVLIDYDSTKFRRHGKKIAHFAVEFGRLLRETAQPCVTLSFSELESYSNPEQLWHRLALSLPRLPKLDLNPNWTPLISRQDSRLPFARLRNPDDAQADLESLGLAYLINNNDTDDAEFLDSVFSAPIKPSLWNRLRKVISAT